MAMLLRDARAVVQKMKKQYDLFEALEAAIVAVEQAQGLEAEKQGVIAALDQHIKELTVEENEYINRINLLKDQDAAMRAAYGKKSEELAKDYDASRRGNANAISLAHDEIEQFRATSHDEMEVLTNNKKALEDQVAALRDKLASLKASINI